MHQEKGGRQQLVPQPYFGQKLGSKARQIVLCSSILIITAASIGAHHPRCRSLPRALCRVHAHLFCPLHTPVPWHHGKGTHSMAIPAVFVVYWRVSRRGYWLLIVSAVIWLGAMAAMKLLLPLDYVPAKWSIPHWCLSAPLDACAHRA